MKHIAYGQQDTLQPVESKKVELFFTSADT